MSSPAGSRPTNREVLLDYIGLIQHAGTAPEGLDELLHPDFVQEIPQSGERVVGIENYRATITNYPGGAPMEAIGEPRIIGDDQPRFVMTPTFNLVKVEGTGDALTGYMRARYPDGTEWYVVSFFTFKDGRIVRQVDFYAPPFDPPEWRSRWVEIER